MKKQILPLFSLLFLVISCSTPAEKAAEGLARRIVPEYARRIVFQEVPGEADFFAVAPAGKKVRIQGNNANSLAKGLGWYLENICGTDVSMHVFDPVQLPRLMPLPDSAVRVQSIVPDRFFLNYCTFGYTMPWWKWEDWERLIDWMALQGVNMPLAITGQEAVWQEVWKQFGLTDEDLATYFTGPAHLPWHRMCNIDGVDGPLPQGWIDGQADLQKRILARERSLGMHPVLPAFGGHVPAALQRLYPDAAITDVSAWCRFPQENLCHFLSPTDSLYGRIQRAFLQAQTRLFGTDHLYGFDLFNEVEAPSWDPETLSGISRGAFGSVQTVDPEARWIQMGWMFHNDRRHWTPENMKAYLEAVPKGKVILLDYYLEHTPVWTLTERFYGQPYLLCYLGNFGGNTRLAGPFHQVSQRWQEARRSGGDNLTGVGCTLEGFGVNTFLYEYMLSRAWDDGKTDAAWVDALADRRTGAPSEIARSAWKDLTDSIYVHGSISEGILMCDRPCLDGSSSWTVTHKSFYDNRTLERIWGKLLLADSDRDTYRFDIVNIGVQVLGNRFAEVRDAFSAAYRSGDRAEALRLGILMKDLLADAARLASTEPQFRLSRWLQDASDFGNTPEEAAYYRRNARHILTVWGGQAQTLRDYASRFWSGLAETYYAPRWNQFIDGVLMAMDEGKSFDMEAFSARMAAFEDQWVDTDIVLPDPDLADAKTLARELAGKYGIIRTFDDSDFIWTNSSS